VRVNPIGRRRDQRKVPVRTAPPAAMRAAEFWAAARLSHVHLSREGQGTVLELRRRIGRRAR
jgi:hypothetical protein